MKKVDTKITINRRSSQVNEGEIYITIRDKKSGNHIISTEISYIDFAQALTGLSEMPCKSEVYDTENVGKIREIMSYFIPKSVFEDCYEGGKREKLIKTFLEADKEFVKLAKEGWKLYHDGLSTQQNGKEHQLSLIRFEEEKDEGTI